MRRITLTIVAAAALAIAPCAVAQGQESYESKHEVGVSIGTGCNSSLLDVLDDATTIALTSGVVKYDNNKRVGAISAEYFYRLRPLVAVGTVVSFSHNKKDAIVADATVGDCKMQYYTLMPAAKFDWVRRAHFGLYSKLAAGITIRHERQRLGGPKDYTYTDCFFNCQASLIGAEAGSRRMRAFAELGFGEQGIVLAGLRCKF